MSKSRRRRLSQVAAAYEAMDLYHGLVLWDLYEQGFEVTVYPMELEDLQEISQSLSTTELDNDGM